MNFIKYGDYNFHGDSARYGKDGLLIEGQVEQRVALFGDELTADSFTFIINSRKCAGEQTGETFNYMFLLDKNEQPIKSSDGKFLIVKNYWPDYRNFTAGTPLDLYNEPDGEIIGRFYVEDVTQVSRKSVKFTCTDAIGVLQKKSNIGGDLWTGTSYITAGALIRFIMSGSGIEYEIEEEVAATQLHGHLKLQNRRVALGNVLTAIGASVIEEKGILKFVFLGGDPETTVLQDAIYLDGGSVEEKTPATKVRVTEHAFYQTANDETVVLFDNTDEGVPANNQLVVFDEPCYGFQGVGQVLVTTNPNYMYVTGVGTITGKKYTHTTRIIERNTGVDGPENIVSIEDNELITIYNSAAVAQRMVNYYKLPLSIEYEQLDRFGLLAAGTPINLVDPFGNFRTGWIRHKSFDLGNKTKARMNVLVDWQGGPYGSSYSTFKTFNASDISSGRIDIPADMQGKDVLLMLIGGAGGGQAGYDGETGHNVYRHIDIEDGLGKPAEGGEGGNGGAAGSLPYVYTIQIPSLASYYTNCAIGVGGAGGASNGALGSAGGATTFGSYSSAQGQRATEEVRNLINGARYCIAGTAGLKGGHGGLGSGYGNTGLDTSKNGGHPQGYAIAGGRYANGQVWSKTQPTRTYYTAGAGGGGSAYATGGTACFGKNAIGGDEATTRWKVVGGEGGKGGDGRAGNPTCAGSGGHGGGGGGGASEGYWKQEGAVAPDSNYDLGTGGAGGAGGAGGKGGDGLIVIYYNA